MEKSVEAGQDEGAGPCGVPPKRRKSSLEHVGGDRNDVIQVHCNNKSGRLHVSKFGSGRRGRCVEIDGGKWLTPAEFEELGGRGGNRSWKTSVRHGDHGKPLAELVDAGVLVVHAHRCLCAVCVGGPDGCDALKVLKPRPLKIPPCSSRHEPQRGKRRFGRAGVGVAASTTMRLVERGGPGDSEGEQVGGEEMENRSDPGEAVSDAGSADGFIQQLEKLAFVFIRKSIEFKDVVLELRTAHEAKVAALNRELKVALAKNADLEKMLMMAAATSTAAVAEPSRVPKMGDNSNDDDGGCGQLWYLIVEDSSSTGEGHVRQRKGVEDGGRTSPCMGVRVEPGTEEGGGSAVVVDDVAAWDSLLGDLQSQLLDPAAEDVVAPQARNLERRAAPCQRLTDFNLPMPPSKEGGHGVDCAMLQFSASTGTGADECAVGGAEETVPDRLVGSCCPNKASTRTPTLATRPRSLMMESGNLVSSPPPPDAYPGHAVLYFAHPGCSVPATCCEVQVVDRIVGNDT